MFIGLLLTSKLKKALHNSPLWQEESVTPIALKITPIDGKEYLGLLTEKENLSYQECLNEMDRVKALLSRYSLDVEDETLLCLPYPLINP